MQNYNKILDFVQKFKKINIWNDYSKKIFARCLFNKIMRSDSVSERLNLLLLGYEKQLPGFEFNNKVELINGKWYFNDKQIPELNSTEKLSFYVELIRLYVQSLPC